LWHAAARDEGTAGGLAGAAMGWPSGATDWADAGSHGIANKTAASRNNVVEIVRMLFPIGHE
jgi:predicted amidohydrolase